jgi:large conductance mechanosensitive channel
MADITAPIIGLFSRGVDLADLFFVLKNGLQGGPYLTLALANKDGAVRISYGLFINSVLVCLHLS